jgi:hypothetical protein
MSNAHRRHDSPATLVTFTGVAQQITSDDAIFLGFSIADDAASSPVVNFHHGTADTDPLIATARKADNGKHETLWFGPNGIHCPDGIYADVTAGTPSGSVYIRT